MASYYNEAVSDARHLPLAPERGAFRIREGFIEIKDAVTGRWRAMYLENGVRVYGPEVD